MTFVNLPVGDPAAARTFFEQLGFSFDDRFSDESTQCLVISEQSIVMLLSHARFAEFAKRPVPEPGATTAVLVGVSAESREEVDALVDKALAAGGAKAGEPVDHGFMYGRSFYDIDGHHWDLVWMDPQALEQGPPDMADSAA